MPRSPCPFVWYELMTADAAAAETFYQAVLGWQMQDAGMPGMRYTILSAGSTPIGGLMALDEAARAAGALPGWIGYLGVDDVDAAARRVVAAGGSIHVPPDDIPGVGRFSVVADPQRAPFVLFRGATPQAPAQAEPGTPGHVGWHELHAGDGPEAFRFYQDQFGWTADEAMDMGPMGVYQLFTTGGEAVGGVMNKSEGMPRPCWLFYVNVESIDAAVERVRTHGGQILHGPHEVPGGSWIVQGLDPQGAMFALVGPRA